MPFFGGVANSLSIYKNFHTMVASKAPAKEGTVMGQGPFGMKYFLVLEVRSELTRSRPLEPPRPRDAPACGRAWLGWDSGWAGTGGGGLEATCSLPGAGAW